MENGQVTGILQVVQNLNDVVETLARLRTALFIGAPIVAIVAALGGYVLATKVLAPIDIITRTADHISSQDLSARLNLPNTHDEVGGLPPPLTRCLRDWTNPSAGSVASSPTPPTSFARH